jgi:hypothetical protein
MKLEYFATLCLTFLGTYGFCRTTNTCENSTYWAIGWACTVLMTHRIIRAITNMKPAQKTEQKEQENKQ